MIGSYQIGSAAGMDMQGENHRGGLRAFVDNLVANSYLHGQFPGRGTSMNLLTWLE